MGKFVKNSKFDELERQPLDACILEKLEKNCRKFENSKCELNISTERTVKNLNLNLRGLLKIGIRYLILVRIHE